MDSKYKITIMKYLLALITRKDNIAITLYLSLFMIKFILHFIKETFLMTLAETRQVTSAVRDFFVSQCSLYGFVLSFFRTCQSQIHMVLPSWLKRCLFSTETGGMSEF